MTILPIIADRYWRLKHEVETHRHTIILHFSPWLISGRAELKSALLSDLGRALGTRLGEDVTQAFGKILKRLMEFAPIAGAGLDIAAHGIGAGGLLRAAGDWSQKIAAKLIAGPSLDDLKRDLFRLLSRLDGQQILVVIDDIDRLTPVEALEMVSPVKSLADLPNVIYLLVYEEERLSQLIREATSADGQCRTGSDPNDLKTISNPKLHFRSRMIATRLLVTSAVVVGLSTSARAAPLSPEDAARHIGETATVCGVVASAKYEAHEQNQPTLLDLGKPHPNAIFTAVIYGENRAKFGAPETSLRGKRICVTGRIRDYNGKAEIVLTEPSQLTE
jgi:hypothetical protein